MRSDRRRTRWCIWAAWVRTVPCNCAGAGARVLTDFDRVLDLALLKLDVIPQGIRPLRALQFADVAPAPGTNATIVGHPASGLLWTLRSGQVAGVGRMPADLVDFVMMQHFASAQAERQQVAEELKRMDSRKIILTSAGANPGDSGDPWLTMRGRVIAVTFAVPADPARAKFSYHVHLDEVRQFMKGVPATPMLLVPDPWDLGPRVQLQDIDRDGTPDVLFGGRESPDMMLFDLDNDTPAALRKNVDSLVRTRKWDFEFALRVVSSESTSAAFYDTDNDGTVDLVDVVEDRDNTKNNRFTRTAAGAWRVEQNVGHLPVAGPDQGCAPSAAHPSDAAAQVTGTTNRRLRVETSDR